MTGAFSPCAQTPAMYIGDMDDTMTTRPADRPLTLVQPETLPGHAGLDERIQQALYRAYWSARRGDASARREYLRLRCEHLETEWVHSDPTDDESPLVQRYTPRAAATLREMGVPADATPTR